MKNDIVQFIEELVSLAKEVEDDVTLSLGIYNVTLGIMEYSNKYIPRSVQLRIYILCCQGIIKLSDDEKLITKLRIDLNKMLEEVNDGIYTTSVSDVS